MSLSATSATSRPRSYWPLATLALLSSLWLAFELDYSSRVHRGIGPEPLPELWVLYGAHPSPWQFVTYAFVHAFRWHLHGNMLVLLPASLLVEARIGTLRTVAAFLSLTMMVSVGFHFIDARDLYGASGAASAFVTMAAVLWLAAKDKSPWDRAIPLILATAHFAWSEFWPAFHGHPSPGWQPHLVGALSGIAAGAFAAWWRSGRK